MVVSRCDGAVDLEVAEDTLDAVALPVKSFVIADRNFAVRLRWDHGFDATFLEIGPDSVGVVSFIGKQRFGLAFRQIDQIVIGFAVRRFTRREVERDGAASSITETMNFTGEPAPRAAKSSSMNPSFPPAAETWARTEVESML